jgi:hypothetical protein
MEGPPEDASDPVRDAIAARSQRLDARCPKAVDLEARVVTILHRRLAGLATGTAGTHLPEHWRAMLRGERSIPMGDFCRLGRGPTREERDAFKAALAELAAAAGFRLEPLSVRAADGLEVAACVAESGGVAAAGLARAMDDGRIDPDEALHLEPAVEALEVNAARARQLLIQAKAQR